MKKQINLSAIEEKELESIIKDAWNENASIDTNLKSVAAKAIVYGQRRLIAEGWQNSCR